MGLLNLSSLANKSPFLSKTKSFVSSLDSIASKASNMRPKYVYPNDMDRQAEANYMIIYIYDLKSNKELVFRSIQQQVAESRISKDLLNKLTGIVSVDLNKDLKVRLNKYKEQALDYLKASLKNFKLGDFEFDLGIDTPQWIKDIGDGIGDAYKYVKDLVGHIDIPSIPNIGSLPDIIDVKINKEKLKDLKNELIKKKFNRLEEDEIGKGYEFATSIVLPLPMSAIEYETKVGVDTADTKKSSIVDSILKSLGGAKLAEAGKTAINAIREQLPEMIKNLTGEGAQAIFQKEYTKMRDPLVAIVYSIPDLRTFKFDYIFAPRTSKELYDVWNIIRTLRFYSLPGKAEETANVRYLSLPACFKIKYYTQGQENIWLGKTKTLALSDIKSSIDQDVSFIKNDFDDISGNPPRIISLSMSFTEMSVLNRSDINEGY